MAHNSAASKRAALRGTDEEDPEFQIAPMIDILLVLLVFFMSISSTEVLQTNDQVKLPVAKNAKDKEKPADGKSSQTIVNVLWTELNNSGSVEVNEKSYGAPSDIINILQSDLVKSPKMRVLVRADKQVRYDYMKAVLKALAAAGVSNVTFSVVDKDPGAKPATAAAD